MAEPSRFLLEIPAELMSGPRLESRAEDDEFETGDDLGMVFGRGATRFGRGARYGGRPLTVSAACSGRATPSRTGTR